MSGSSSLAVGVAQFSCAEDPAKNDATAERMIREAAKQGARIVCLPELYRGRYFCQSEDYRCFELAESIPGPSTERLGSLARELGVVILASLFERRAAGLYHNTLAVILPDGTLGGIYRKMHIPDDPLYFEKFYFTPGDLGFQAIETPYGRVGTLICWDQWYPEAARLTAMKGAGMLFYPTAIGWHPSEKEDCGAAQREAWELIQRSHALANGCYVIAANRFGFEPTPDGAGEGIEFWGGSFAAGPDGQVIARAPADEEALLVVPVDLARVDAARTHWPFFRDRRIDAYGGLTERYLDG